MTDKPTGPNPFADDPLAPKSVRPATVAPPSLLDADPAALNLNPFAADPLAAKPKSAVPPPPPRDVYRGSILPFAKDEQGNVRFAPFDAGIIGSMKQAFTLPGRVYRGETRVDPSDPAFMGEVLNFAGSFGPNINPAIRSGDRVFPGVVRNAPDPMSVPTPLGPKLLEEGGKQIEAFRGAPVRYNPGYIGDALAQQLESKLIKEGVYREDSPGLYQSIDRLRDYKPKRPGDEIIVEPGNLISIRKNIAEKFGKQGESQHGVGVAFEHFNNFLKNPPEGAVLAGPAAEAARTYERGLGNYAAGMRDAELQSIKRTADLRTASANSGQNPDNTLRSRITSHILNDKKVRGYTPDEVAILEGIPEGSTANNILRGTSNVLGGGGGVVGTSMAGGAAYGLGHLFGLGEPASAAFAIAAPIVGNILRRAAGRGTKEALDEAATVMRQRSPLFQESVKAYGAPSDPARDAMARTLLRLEAQGTGGVPVDPPMLDQPEGTIPRITVRASDRPY